MIIRHENTAIVNGVSKSAFEIEKISFPGCSVLDYGCGKLRNSKYLVSKGIQVDILDSKLQLSRLKKEDLDLFSEVYIIGDKIEKSYDFVLCSFVLNVIEYQDIRIDVLQRILLSLKVGGILSLEVRRGRGIMSNKNMTPYEDGFLVGTGEIRTFQKPYCKDEVDKLLRENGFIVLSSKAESDSIVAIARK